MSSRTNNKGDEGGCEERLKQARTAGSIPLPPDHVESLYLPPQNIVKGQHQQPFGNPTPIALAGLLLCSTPVSLSLLGWKGAGGFLAAANVGAFFYVGGLLLVTGGIGEWIHGKTFPATVFFTFAGFWLTIGSTIVPEYGAYSLYSTGEAAEGGLKEPQFYATFAFFLVGMAIICAIFTVACVRTNLVFLIMFLLFTPCFACLAGSFFAVAEGDSSKAIKLQHAGSGILLAATILGWYLFTSLVLLSVDFPLCLPLGDLSMIVLGYDSRAKKTSGAV